MLTHPIEPESMKRKMIALINKMAPESKTHPVHPENLQDAVRVEINRATRGNYPLSFIMISPPEMSDEHKDIFLEN